MPKGMHCVEHTNKLPGGRCRVCQYNRERNYHRERRLSLLAFFGGKCVRCGFSDGRALQIDHINGGGNMERQKMPSPDTFRKHVMQHPDAYQLLCANCNAIKRIENNESYHLATIQEEA